MTLVIILAVFVIVAVVGLGLLALLMAAVHISAWEHEQYVRNHNRPGC